MQGHRDGSIDDGERNGHRDEAHDSNQFVTSDLSLKKDWDGHDVVGHSNEMVVFATGLSTDCLAHDLFTFGAKINVKTDQNVDENDDSDGLLESQDGVAVALETKIIESSNLHIFWIEFLFNSVHLPNIVEVQQSGEENSDSEVQHSELLVSKRKNQECDSE